MYITAYSDKPYSPKVIQFDPDFFKGSRRLIPRRAPSGSPSGISLMNFIGAISVQHMSASLLMWCLLSPSTPPVLCEFTCCSPWDGSNHLHSSDPTQIPLQTRLMPTRCIWPLPLPSSFTQPWSNTLPPLLQSLPTGFITLTCIWTIWYEPLRGAPPSNRGY